MLYSSACTDMNSSPKISTLEEQRRALENEITSSYTVLKENKLKAKQAELNDLLRNRAEYMLQTTKHKYDAEGSKP